MTQMEKSLNRGDLKGFKASKTSLNAMVPGLFSESPLRGVSVPPRNAQKSGYMENSNSLKMNLIAAQKAEYDEMTGKPSVDGHYNMGAPIGHWRPQHRRAVSYMDLKAPADDIS